MRGGLGPAFFIGGAGDVEKTLVPHIAASGEVRAQFYTHPEDEHFGSHGLQLDTTAGLRAYDGPAFIAVRVGGGVLHGWPYEGNQAPCTECTDTGFVGVVAVGFDG